MNIILNIRPPKVMHVFPPDSHPPHVLHRTYITAGHVTAWYSLLLVAVDIFLDCSTLIELK